MEQLTNEEKIELIRGGLYSMDQFIRENEGLVVSAAFRHVNGSNLASYHWDEVLNAARMGLYRAAKDFDGSQGFAFTTLAYKVISFEVMNCLRSIFNENRRMMEQVEWESCTVESTKAVGHTYHHYTTDGLHLTARQQEIFELYLKHMSFEKVAKILNVKKQTIHESVQKTQEKMRKKYQHLISFN